MNDSNENQKKQDCNDKRNCIEMLQLILDGEATPEQKNDFKLHINDCMPCFQNYHFDQTIKELLKVKCCSEAPQDLIESIRNKIQANTVH